MFKRNRIKEDKQLELPFFIQDKVEDFFETVRGTEEDYLSLHLQEYRRGYFQRIISFRKYPPKKLIFLKMGF